MPNSDGQRKSAKKPGSHNRLGPNPATITFRAPAELLAKLMAQKAIQSCQMGKQVSLSKVIVDAIREGLRPKEQKEASE